MLESHSANVTTNPPDGPLNRLKSIELHPNSLPHSRSLDKLNFASFRGGIENLDTKGMNTRTPKVGLSGNRLARSSSRFRHKALYHDRPPPRMRKASRSGRALSPVANCAITKGVERSTISGLHPSGGVADYLSARRLVESRRSGIGFFGDVYRSLGKLSASPSDASDCTCSRCSSTDCGSSPAGQSTCPHRIPCSRVARAMGADGRGPPQAHRGRRGRREADNRFHDRIRVGSYARRSDMRLLRSCTSELVFSPS